MRVFDKDSISRNAIQDLVNPGDLVQGLYGLLCVAFDEVPPRRLWACERNGKGDVAENAEESRQRHPVLADEEEIETSNGYWKCVEYVYDGERLSLVGITRALREPDVGDSIFDLRNPKDAKHGEPDPEVWHVDHHSLGYAGQAKSKN